MKLGWRRIIRPHNILATIFIFSTVWLLSLIHIDHHVINPFKNGIKDYDVTDIVYSQLRDEEVELEQRIVLVNTGQPDRARINKMLERILEGNPRVIGVDVILEDEKDPVIDSMLRATLMSTNKVVLAASLGAYDKRKGYFKTPPFEDNYFYQHATLGFANFPSLETRTLRYFSPYEPTSRGKMPSFSTAIAKKYNSDAVRFLKSREKKVERIHYTSKQDSYIKLEAENILDSSFQIKSVVEGKIIILGYIEEYGPNDPIVDRFYTPLNEKYYGRSVPDMYGAVVHANVIQMILDKDYVEYFPKWIVAVFAVILVYFNTFFFFWNYKYWWYFKPFPNILYRLGHIVQIIQIVIMFFVMAWVFSQHQIKIEFKLAIVSLILAFDLCTIYYYLRKNFSILGNIPEYFPGGKTEGTEDNNTHH